MSIRPPATGIVENNLDDNNSNEQSIGIDATTSPNDRSSMAKAERNGEGRSENLKRFN